MGWLHEGHTSLIGRARADSATVVVSIFVNPRQFGETTDFTKYPRNEARDLAICEAAGVDLVFAPPVDEVYVPGFDTTRHGRRDRRAARGRGAARALRRRRHGRRDPVLAGRRRAGLLRAQGLPAGPGDPADGAGPRAADRGRRPRHRPGAGRAGALVAQRPALTRRVARRRRSSAGRCWRASRACAAASATPTAVRAEVSRVLASEPLADPDYVSVADPDTLAELATIGDAGALLSMAVHIEGVRLIDNERV